MKNLIYPIIILAIASILFFAFKSPNVDFNKDSHEGIQFYKGAWQEALEKAEKENKIIFLDVYATWCGPCKKLKAYTFSDATVGSFYNNNFINVAVDGEKGEGIELAKKYSVRAYPTLLFINSSGEIVHRTAGYHKANDFNELGELVVKNIKR
ncbi:MAG: thioredoxin fold domain-containing protein [Vicingaceae bacterium]|nr:thioredoxin fold domain-containing protein [Vicingaceae bacterium]